MTSEEAFNKGLKRAGIETGQTEEGKDIGQYINWVITGILIIVVLMGWYQRVYENKSCDIKCNEKIERGISALCKYSDESTKEVTLTGDNINAPINWGNLSKNG